MRYNIVYTHRALDDLNRLRNFIREYNPRAAKTMSRQLLANIQALSHQPNMGVDLTDIDDCSELDGCRELIARDYIVRYRIEDDEIIILNIWHGRESR